MSPSLRDSYIVMELVEGATLLDHLNSLAEKSEAMPEQRVWSIFTQVLMLLGRELAALLTPAAALELRSLRALRTQ